MFKSHTDNCHSYAEQQFMRGFGVVCIPFAAVVINGIPAQSSHIVCIHAGCKVCLSFVERQGHSRKNTAQPASAAGARRFRISTLCKIRKNVCEYLSGTVDLGEGWFSEIAWLRTDMILRSGTFTIASWGWLDWSCRHLINDIVRL